MPEAVRVTKDCYALTHPRPDSERAGLVKAGSALLVLREEERDYYKVAFGGQPVFIPRSCAVHLGPEEAAALGPAEEPPGKLTQFLVGFFGVIASGLIAAIAVGLLWQTAGLVLGLVYLSLYLASVVIAFGLRRNWAGVGMLAAALFAAPMFLAVAFLTWFSAYYER